jgi:hypothetical protein
LVPDLLVLDDEAKVTKIFRKIKIAFFLLEVSSRKKAISNDKRGRRT